MKLTSINYLNIFKNCASIFIQNMCKQTSNTVPTQFFLRTVQIRTPTIKIIMPTNFNESANKTNGY
jgi:hypothetical protein